MSEQKPPSRAALIASGGFFVLLGLPLGIVGLTSIGKDPSAVWIALFGLGIAALAIWVTSIALKNVAKLEKGEKIHHPKHAEHAASTTTNVPMSSPDFSGIGAIVMLIIVAVVGFYIVKGVWNFASEQMNPPKWTGFFYYDTNDLDKYWTQGGFADLDGCRSWVNAQISRDFDGEYDYECGKGCRYEPGFTVQVCKETLR